MFTSEMNANPANDTAAATEASEQTAVITAEQIAKMREKYAPLPVPSCVVCGGALVASKPVNRDDPMGYQSMVCGAVTAAFWDNPIGSEAYSAVSGHYYQSCVVVRSIDTDLILLLDAAERLPQMEALLREVYWLLTEDPKRCSCVRLREGGYVDSAPFAGTCVHCRVRAALRSEATTV